MGKKRDSEKKRTVIRIRARRAGGVDGGGCEGRDANTKTKEETKLR